MSAVDEPSMEEMREFEKSHEWLMNNLPELKQDYRGKFIAAHKDRIIATGDTKEEIEKKLSKKDVDLSVVVVKYIEEKGSLILR